MVTILCSLFCSISYSQPPKLPPLQEINRALAEGNEAKELLKKRSVSLHKCDSVLDGFKKSGEMLQKENSLLSQNNAVLEAQKVELSKKYDASVKEEDKQRSRKVFWRGTAICTSLITVLLLILVFL